MNAAKLLCWYLTKYSSKIILFSIFLVQTSKTMFRWIIVQDDKNSISTALVHMNLIFQWKYRDTYVLVNLELMKCILINVRMYFLYCDRRNINHNRIYHYHFKTLGTIAYCMYASMSWKNQSTHCIHSKYRFILIS